MTSRVALVTGGTGGIGTAICKKLADMGHKVATNYRNEEKARAWQAQQDVSAQDRQAGCAASQPRPSWARPAVGPTSYLAGRQGALHLQGNGPRRATHQ